MNGCIVRVKAYHGRPVVVDGIPTRSSYTSDNPIPGDQIVNDPTDLRFVINNPANSPTYTLVELVDAFEDANHCKVNLHENGFEDGTHVVLLDVFEPSWDNEDDAFNVIDELTDIVISWVMGVPIVKQ